LIRWPHNNKTRGRGRPYVYSPTVILRCFIVRIWFRLDSNRALHEYLAMDLSYNRKVMTGCGLSRIPNRRTFDRRLATISNDIKNRINTMGELFVNDKIINPFVLSTDSTLMKAKGYVWHKSSMEEGVLPRSGIDTDARWGFSHTKGWIFGYKLHLISSTGSIIVPLSADFTTANIPDNQMYSILTASIPFTIIRRTLYMSADPGYDDHELYNLSTDMGFQLVCPAKRYKNTSEERIKLVEFYESDVGQAIYSLRGMSIEPLIGHIKSAFRIDPLPVRGYDNTCAIVLLSVLLYQILVYYNCKTNIDNPMTIKYMLGT
jgi:Transposase DDE domain